MNAKSLSAPGLFLAGAVMIALIVAVAMTAGASSRYESGSGPVSVMTDEAPRAAGASALRGEREADGLMFMREEEKLARDVYRTLGKSGYANLLEHCRVESSDTWMRFSV